MRHAGLVWYLTTGVIAASMAAGAATQTNTRGSTVSWQRPKTIKLYLAAPESDRLVTMWPDFKIVTTEVDRGDRAAGFRVLLGDAAEAVAWERTRFHVRKDGIPVHAMEAHAGSMRYSIEAFCTWDRTPVTYARLTVTNEGTGACPISLGLMPRTGLDTLLYGIAPDFYASYRPLLEHWDMVRSTWQRQGDRLIDSDGNRIGISAPKALATEWMAQNPHNQFAKSYLALKGTVPAGKPLEVWITLAPTGTEAPPGESAYTSARNAAIQQWRDVLAGVHTYPKCGAKLRPMVNSLICQCLQMLARGSDGVVKPRQGGRSAGVWPTEAMEFLRALDRLGLTEWSEKGYRFLARNQVTEGPDRGRILSVGAPSWLNPTGATLYGLGYHVQQAHNPTLFATWREPMVRGLEWIAAQRARTRTTPGTLGYGLLPAGKAHDWGIEGQSWCFSDGFTYMGVRETAAAFAKYSDPQAASVQAAADDYEACLKATLATVAAAAKNRDELFVPNLLGVAETYPPVGPYFADGPATLIRAGIVDPHSQVFEGIQRYFERHGWMRNGLTGLMTDCLITQGFLADPWAGHTWYTSLPDIAWFQAWLASGKRDRARQTLDAQIRYGMTPEWYMQERFADNDPTFCPWQPNASANGRLLMMLFDYYGEVPAGRK